MSRGVRSRIAEKSGWEKAWVCAVCGEDSDVSVLGIKLCNLHLDQRYGSIHKDKSYTEFERKVK